MVAMTDVRYAVAPITAVDVRDTSGTDDNTWTMSGYAAVFDEMTTLYDGKFLKITEELDAKAFDTVLRDQPMREAAGVVHFNLGHDMNRAVAATDVLEGQPGSLKLTADKQGLFFLAKVPRDDPDGIALATKMRSGVIRQASFAFTIGALQSSTDTMTDDGPDVIHDRILEVKHLYDVCACAQGAYSQTVSGLRSYAAAIGQPPDGGGHPRQPDGGAIPVSPETGGGVDTTPLAIIEWPDLREQLRRHRPIRVDSTEGTRDVRRDAGRP
jgi:HK97 family phage prohead protease